MEDKELLAMSEDEYKSYVSSTIQDRKKHLSDLKKGLIKKKISNRIKINIQRETVSAKIKREHVRQGMLRATINGQKPNMLRNINYFHK